VKGLHVLLVAATARVQIGGFESALPADVPFRWRDRGGVRGIEEGPSIISLPAVCHHNVSDLK
jgi:hypothetical protein